MDATGAELAKLASNSFRTTKIAFANSLAELCAAHGSDPRAVCAAVGADPHIGRGFLIPGLPYGGPCFPRDNPALSAAAALAGVPAPLPEAVEAANEQRFREFEGAVLAAAPDRSGSPGSLSSRAPTSSRARQRSSLPSAGRPLGVRWSCTIRLPAHQALPRPAHSPLCSTPAPSCSSLWLTRSQATELLAELAGREHPPAVVDARGALSRPRRVAAETHPRCSPHAAG